MRNKDINMHQLPRFTGFNNLKNDKEISKKLIQALNQKEFHFRIKSRNRNKDILTFEILTKYFYS